MLVEVKSSVVVSLAHWVYFLHNELLEQIGFHELGEEGSCFHPTTLSQELLFIEVIRGRVSVHFLLRV